MSNFPSGCLGFLFGRRQARYDVNFATAFPRVQVNKYFVSDAEANFFRVLIRVVGERGHVLAQVSLRQLLWMPGSNQSNPGRARWQNKIAAKTLDFVICDPATLRPRLVIELDEPSHAQPARQTRDEEVEAILQAAGVVEFVPFIAFPDPVEMLIINAGNNNTIPIAKSPRPIHFIQGSTLIQRIVSNSAVARFGAPTPCQSV